MQTRYLGSLGDRMPGTSGAEVLWSITGKVPDGFDFSPTRRRYPIIACRLHLLFSRMPAKVATLAGETDLWWRTELERVTQLDEAEAITLFEEATRRFEATLTTHAICVLAVVQPLYQIGCSLVERTGQGEVGLLSGSGGAEMQIVQDMWNASRDISSLAEVTANHGFHGPMEGEISSRVWREDPAPLRRMIDEYAARDDATNPVARVQADRTRVLRCLGFRTPQARA